MKQSLRLFASCLPLLLPVVSALKLPVRQTKRGSFGIAHSGTNNAAGSDKGEIIGLTDNQNLVYIANVTIAGQSYPVQLDTGSSDLWIHAANGVLGKKTDITYNLTYGTGYASGPIATAPVSFAGFDIPNQAYLAGQDVNNPAVSYGAQGILGTGFTSLSGIDAKVNQTGGDWGRCLLYNIFALHIDEPNFMAFALQRDDDPDHDVTGSFTIGEYIEEYKGVAQTAPIPTFPETSPKRWTLLVDRIIANGQSVPMNSVIKDAPSNKAVALLDTGTSYVYAPPRIVSAIYGSIPDATYSEQLAQWVVPCSAEVDVSIVINGRQFDIHPLDTVVPSSSDSQLCTGSWLPQTLSVGSSDFDLLLGDAVLRSLYTVYDFGDFDSNQKMGAPYLRLWSLVNGSDASNEFHTVRGGTPNNTFLSNENVNAASTNAISPSTSDSPPNDSSLSDLQSKVDKIYKFAPIALGLAGLNALVMFGVLVFALVKCLRRNKNKDQRSIPPSGSFIPLSVGGLNVPGHDYRPISLAESSRSSAPLDPPKYGAGVRYND